MAVIVEGAIRQVGPVADVFSAPVDAGVARVVGMENVLPAQVVRREDGLVAVRSGEAEIVAVDPGGGEDDVFACIRAEDVVVEPEAGHDSSARNHLAGTVASRQEEGPLVRLRVACGVPLVALVTRASADRLALRPGTRVTAVVKAPGVRIVGRGSRHR
jgi:molybdate transport system ATP-binding protein